MKNYILLIFIIILRNYFPSYSQGLCNNSNYETGDFEISEINVCVPNLLTLTKGSEIENARYMYDYQGESIEEVKVLSKIQETYSYSDIGKPKIYTILQVGEKKGKISIACKNVNVRTNNEPVYSYTVCGSLVEFNLPKHSLNDFDKYYLGVGSNAVITIQKDELPYSVKFSMALPQLFKISGFYLNLGKNCPNNPSFRTIPAPSINIDLPYYPNIDKMELITPSNVKIDYSGPYNDSNTDLSASLYRFEKNLPPSSAIEIKKNLVPGQYEFSIPDSNKSYCFFVKKNNICNGQIEESADLCTHPLTNVDFDPDLMRYDLKWNQYPSTFKGLSLASFPMAVLTGLSYNPSPKKIHIKISDLNVSTITRPPYQSSYSHYGIDCKKKYCYQIEQAISGTIGYVQYRGISKSNKVCRNQSEVIVPAVSDIYTSTLNNKNTVFIKDDNTWPLKKEKWYLYKKNSKGYIKVDSVLDASQGLTDNDLVLKSESYKVSYIDQCKSKSFLSDSISSVFLDFVKPNALKWTDQSPFSNNTVDKYDIFYLPEGGGGPVKIEDLIFNQTNVDLTPFNEVAKFLVKTFSTGANPKNSYSNVVTYNIPPQVFVPDVFTPNGDSDNDVLEIKGKLSRGVSFEMQIFNRFGQQIATINDIFGSWNGTFKGKEVDTGMYSYKVVVNLDTGEKYIKTGTVQLKR
jgi:gliding motility-associated-like protein